MANQGIHDDAPASFPILENARCGTDACPRTYAQKHFGENSQSEISVTVDRVVYNESQSAAFTYCIKKGAVKIYKSSHGRQVLVDVVLAGTLIGGIHQEGHYQETAEALSGAVLCQVNREAYAEWMRASKDGLRIIFVQSENTLREARVRQVLMSKLSAIERLSYFLYRFASESLKINPVQQRLMVPFKLSRADYADLVGTSVESVVRMLKDLCERGVLRIRAKEIEIKDFAKLKEIAGIQGEENGRK